MRDGGGRARIAAPAVAPLPHPKFHSSCGKFCAEVNSEPRKALDFQVFHAFEPRRSNPPKQLSGNDLAFHWRNCKQRRQIQLINRAFLVISTVEGDR